VPSVAPIGKKFFYMSSEATPLGAAIPSGDERVTSLAGLTTAAKMIDEHQSCGAPFTTMRELGCDTTRLHLFGSHRHTSVRPLQ